MSIEQSSRQVVVRMVDLFNQGDVDGYVQCFAPQVINGMGRLPVNGGLLVGVPPTGKRFAADHIHLLRLQGGLVCEHYACRDDIEMMRQLGLLPDVRVADTKKER